MFSLTKTPAKTEKSNKYWSSTLINKTVVSNVYATSGIKQNCNNKDCFQTYRICFLLFASLIADGEYIVGGLLKTLFPSFFHLSDLEALWFKALFGDIYLGEHNFSISCQKRKSLKLLIKMVCVVTDKRV